MTERRSRSSNGESSIFEDPQGVWHGYVTMGVKNNGKPDRRHRQGPSRKAVAGKVRELEKQRDAGRVTEAGSAPTVAAWITYWLENVAPARVDDNTLDDYRGLMERHVIPGLGAHRLDRLQPEHVEMFYGAKVRKEGLAPSTVLKIHRILSRALKVAHERDKVARNVCSLVDPPTLPPREAAALTADQARAVLELAMKDRLAARWAFAMEIGCRQGEALALWWSDLTLNTETGAGSVTIRRQLKRSRARHGCPNPGSCQAKQPIRCPQAIGGGLILKNYPKNKRPRHVALSPFLVTALMYHREFQAGERAAAGSAWPKDTHGDLVFRQPLGRPVDPRADHRAWSALLVQAGVPHGGTHLARHTAATLMLESGEHARVVMEVLGHSDIGVTMNTYAHVSRELSTAAAERMGGVLWQPR